MTSNRPSNDHQTTSNRPQYNKDNNNNKYNNKLNYTKLNYLFLYLINEKEDFENLSNVDKENIQNILKRLDIYVEKIECIPTQKLKELKIQYWAITEVYLSSYRIYLNNLNFNNLNFRFLKAKEYCTYNDDEELNNFVGYFIKSIREEIKNDK